MNGFERFDLILVWVFWVLIIFFFVWLIFIERWCFYIGIVLEKGCIKLNSIMFVEVYMIFKFSL